MVRSRDFGWNRGVIACFCLCLGAILTLGTSEVGAAEKILFRLSWIKTSSDAGVYYYAKEKGLFAAEGLDLTVVEGKGSATNVKLIAAGDGLLGVADLGTAMKAIVKDVPVRAVYGTFQENPMAIMSLASKPIKTPQDLLGKNLVAIAEGSFTKIFPVLCKKTNIDCKKINLLFASPPFQTYLIAGKADGFLGYFTDDVPKLEVAGHKAHAMRYSDHGVDVLSNGIIARPDKLEAKADVVKRFLRASAKVWRIAKDNPDEVVDVWMGILGRGERALYLAILKNSTSILQTRYTRGKPLGWMAEEDWKNTQDTLASAGELDRTLPIERYYTNEFISDVK